MCCYTIILVEFQPITAVFGSEHHDSVSCWFSLDLLTRCGNQHPDNTGGFIVCLTRIPSLPNLVSQFLINQQGFDVEFDEHGLRMACLWDQFSLRN